MKEASPRQAECLRIIEAFIAEHGYSPTTRELTALLGLKSVNGTTELLAALVRKGYLRRDEKKARSIVLCVDPFEPAPVEVGDRLVTDDGRTLRVTKVAGNTLTVEAAA